ncbi:MAG: hypothetical protein JRI34_11525 [Deltaproteobacteria bacterium]|nr:hypothetical protein [Deltaproteobacteria bacterium]
MDNFGRNRPIILPKKIKTSRDRFQDKDRYWMKIRQLRGKRLIFRQKHKRLHFLTIITGLSSASVAKKPVLDEDSAMGDKSPTT